MDDGAPVVLDGAVAFRGDSIVAVGDAQTVLAAHPSAEALVELAVPRLLREDFDRLYDVQPIYIRKADAEIAWDQRRGAG